MLNNEQVLEQFSSFWIAIDYLIPKVIANRRVKRNADFSSKIIKNWFEKLIKIYLNETINVLKRLIPNIWNRLGEKLDGFKHFLLSKNGFNRNLTKADPQ